MNVELMDRVIASLTERKREFGREELLDAALKLVLSKGRRIEDDPGLESTDPPPACLFCNEEFRHHPDPSACLVAALFQIERLEDLVYILAARPNGWLHRELEFYKATCSDMARRLAEPMPVPPERPYIVGGVAAKPVENYELFAA